MQNLTQYLTKADAYLQAERRRRLAGETSDLQSLFNARGEVHGEYPGFAASFGATVLRSGLLPAVFLYAEKQGEGRSRLPLAGLLLHLLRNSDQGPENQSLMAYVLHHRPINEYRLRRRVLDAAIAAKLALRTFPVANKTPAL